ncbi:MAG: hypothetical protein LBR79_03040 [Oscillospiraceae bacterium]|nr:hypothetical protein [Oscillospiraceae bacterium]
MVLLTFLSPRRRGEKGAVSTILGHYPRSTTAYEGYSREILGNSPN